MVRARPLWSPQARSARARTYEDEAVGIDWNIINGAHNAGDRPTAEATQAVASGFIAVNPGHRGKGTSSSDSSGKTIYDGKSPWCLIDLKAGIRYLVPIQGIKYLKEIKKAHFELVF